MMVSVHRAWIKSMVAFPPGLVFLFCCAVSMASAQSKTAPGPAPATAQTVSGPAGAVDKTPANPQKPMEKVQDLAAELKELRDVQIGLVLTLAACGDEPHCVSGVNHQEISSMQERLRKVTEQLGQETPQTQETLREALQMLEKEADNLRISVVKVETEIDETKLEGDWSDQFVFDDFNAAPAVPFPNEKVPLVRFEDAEQPLPLE
jgi:hypothetical protein